MSRTGALLPLGVALTCYAAPAAADLRQDATPVLPAGELALPERALSAAVRPNDGFTGTTSLAAEVLALYEVGGDHDGLVVRPCATVRLGPLVACGGAVIAPATTTWNIHVEVASYQRDGWEFAIGAGVRDGATARVAVPLTAAWLPWRTKAVRLRTMYSFVGAHRVGAGLELDAW